MESETKYFKDSEQVRPLDMSHLLSVSLELHFRLGRKLLLATKRPLKKKKKNLFRFAGRMSITTKISELLQLITC